MTAEEALAILDEILQQAHLSDVQEIVFRHCWEGQTYAEIAEAAGYDTGYIKDVGSKLWQFLSSTLGEKVTKNNLQAVLRRQQGTRAAKQAEVGVQTPETAGISEEHSTSAQGLTQSHPHLVDPGANPGADPLTHLVSHPITPDPSTSLPPVPRVDWGEAVDVSIFYGRTKELERLIHWLTVDRCRVVSLLGMGGIGKTSLSVKLSQQLVALPAVDFQSIIWRSLRNAPPAEDMLVEWIRFLSQEQETAQELPPDLNGRLTRLVHYLRSTRSLLILDNAETILRSGEHSGYFHAEYEGYGEILKRLAELPHQSCVLITSRENPRTLTVLEGETLPVRTLRLSGISEAEAHRILQDKGTFSGTASEWQELTTRYGGNPLALKVVATTIQELFDGNIAAFLAEGTTVFDDIRYLLRQQFDRLSQLEQSIMYWLAINREPTLIPELQEDLMPTVSKSKLIEAVGILRWRSLIEKTVNHYTQQPVIMEYVVERLIEKVSQEIMNEELSLFIRHALIKAPVKDYIRDSQIRVILQPLIDRLYEVFSNQQSLEHQLNQILLNLQSMHRTAAGYGAGNLLNLFRQLGTDLTGANFSELAIVHAYLQDVPLHQVDFSQSHISKSVFAQRLGSILSVAFSPDGKLLASSDADGEICLWQVADGKQLLICKEEQNYWVWSVSFSPDSQILASSCEDKTIKLWDINTGECLQELVGHTNWTFSVTFSPNGEWVASSSEDRTIKLWDIATGDCLSTFSGHEAGIRAVVFAPDGQQLASTGADQTVRLWDVATGNCTQILKIEGIGRSLCFSPNGKWLVNCSDDQTLRLWNLSTCTCERVFTVGSRCWSVAFSPDSQFLLTGSDDQRLRLWEIYTDEPIRSFEGHTGLVLAVAFSPDGQTAVSGSDDQTIKFWEVDTGRCLKTVKGHNNWVWSVDFSPSPQNSDRSHRPASRQLASAHEDRTIRLWQTETGRCTHILEGHSGRIWSLDYSPQGQILASGSDDQTIKFWQVEASPTPSTASSSSASPASPFRSVPIGRCIKTLRGQTGAVRLVLFSPDGFMLASNSGDCTVKLWDVSSLYPQNPDENLEPARSQLGRMTAGRSGEWVSGQCLAVLEETERVLSVAFSPEGQHLATANEGQTISLWQIETATRCNILTGHTDPVLAVAFSPKGDRLASGSADGTVRLWDWVTGTCQRVIAAAVGRVGSVAFSPDGTQLAIGGSDPVVLVWDLVADQPLERLQGHTKTLQTLAFCPTGQQLATGSEDETIRLWSVPSGQLNRILRANRPYEGLNLTDVSGLTAAQKATLKLLGAIEY